MKKGVDYIGISVSFVCHDGKGNYLMSKRSTKCRDEHGTWDFGGGGLDFGETVEDCLKREIKEELGVEPLEYKFLGCWDNFRNLDGLDTHWIALEYLVLVDPAKVVNSEPDKFDELKWFRLDNLPAPLHSAVTKILTRFEEELSR